MIIIASPAGGARDEMWAKVNALRESDPHRPALPTQGETPPPMGGLPGVTGAERSGRQEGVCGALPVAVAGSKAVM